MSVWTRPATVVRVHDGDTLVGDLDLGRHAVRRSQLLDLGWHIRLTPDGRVLLRNGIRIQGLAAPELVTDAGKAAAAFAKTLVGPGEMIEVESLALYGSFEKYGRILASVKLKDGRDFAEAMIAAGHAVAWDGAGKQPGIEHG